jgi:hypothetical protein
MHEENSFAGYTLSVRTHGTDHRIHWCGPANSRRSNAYNAFRIVASRDFLNHLNMVAARLPSITGRISAVRGNAEKSSQSAPVPRQVLLAIP